MDMLSPHRQAARLTTHRDIRHRCHRDSRPHPDRRQDRARARGPEQRQGTSSREPTERATQPIAPCIHHGHRGLSASSTTRRL